MPRTKKPAEPTPPPTVVNGLETAGEVLTLAEAATYLRLPEPEVVGLVHSQDLPGRFAGGEWRFLKSAIQKWLSTPPPRYSKEAQLAVIGSWKDDPYVEEELKEIMRQRGR